jgi:hypothetical protein
VQDSRDWRADIGVAEGAPGVAPKVAKSRRLEEGVHVGRPPSSTRRISRAVAGRPRLGSDIPPDVSYGSAAARASYHHAAALAAASATTSPTTTAPILARRVIR